MKDTSKRHKKTNLYDVFIGIIGAMLIIIATPLGWIGLLLSMILADLKG